MKQKLLELKEVNSSTIIVIDFNILVTVMSRKTREKIRK